VKQASVSVDGEAIGVIAKGLVVLFCAEDGDADADTDFFARKIARMRIFEDGDGRFNRSLLDVGGAVLVVSQFTLAAA
jgi:D-tyrosyl-tRNA(Tyr) deacylase